MASFPHFGDAVDAVFGYLQNGGDPLAMDAAALQDHLLARPFGKRIAFMKPVFFHRVLACWHYLARMLEGTRILHVDGNRRSRTRVCDVIFIRRGMYYVIEVKTHPPARYTQEGVPHNETALAQVWAGMEHLLLTQKVPPHLVEGYVVFIENWSHGPMRIEKKRVLPSKKQWKKLSAALM